MASTSPTTSGGAAAAAATPPSLPSFHSALSNVAVAQICQSVGYRSAHSSALRSLSDLAGRYLQTLARLAAAAANSHGRTDSNLFDVILAIEDLSYPRGFAGASDPKKPLLRSGVLKEIIAFVGSVDEIPFPRPIRRDHIAVPRKRTLSFAQSEKDPPFPHVPRWLPGFPDSWGCQVRGEKRVRKVEEEWWPRCDENREVDLGIEVSEGKRRDECDLERRILPLERARMKFKLGFGPGKGSGSRTVEKRKTDVLHWKGDEEQNNCLGSMRKLRRCEVGRCMMLIVSEASSKLSE